MILRNIAVLLAGSMLTVINGSAAITQSAAPMSDAKLQAVSGMAAELQAAKAEEAAQVQSVNESDSLVIPKNKELKVYGDQIPALKTKYAALNTDLVVHNAEATKHQAASNTHNAGCGGSLSNAAAARCNGEVEQLNAWSTRINGKKEDLDKRGRELDKARDSILARAKVLESELAQLEARKTESMQKLEQARKRISALTSRFGTLCAGIPTSSSMEEVKLKCGNVDFDGSRSTLPACDTEKCKEYDRLTHGR
jgi:chromosome segregation ATPase